MFKYTDAVSFETSKSDWQVDCQKVLTSTEGTKMSFKKAMEICLSNTWLNIQSIADRDLDWKWVLNTYRWAWGLFVTAAVLAAVAAATAASACRKQIRSFNIFHHLHAKWKHFNKLQKKHLTSCFLLFSDTWLASPNFFDSRAILAWRETPSRL